MSVCRMYSIFEQNIISFYFDKNLSTIRLIPDTLLNLYCVQFVTYQYLIDSKLDICRYYVIDPIGHETNEIFELSISLIHNYVLIKLNMLDYF